MGKKKVVVIGCGASGMMAAIAAAKAGAEVTVLESQKHPGRKLLMTGNSRCNLTNLAPRPEAEYQSGDEERVLPLVKSVFRQFPAGSTLDLFHQMGLLTMVEHNTYVYPVTGQSQSVLNILLEELKELGVKLKYSEKAVSVRRTEKDGASWTVLTEGWHYEADSVILACGGRSCPQTGSDGSGYALAEGLGMKVTDVVPALTGISVRFGKQPVTLKSLQEEQKMLYEGSGDLMQDQEDKSHRAPEKKKEKEEKALLSSLAGVRMNAGVSVFIDRVPAARDIGQLQFTATDLSGIVVFQVSRKVSRALRAGKKAEIRLDLLPAFTEDEVETIISRYAENHPDAPLKMAFCGLLPQQLVPVVLKAAGAADRMKGEPKASDLDKMFIRAVSETIKSFRLEATGVRGFESCQVTAGGVALSEVDPESLEASGPALSGIFLTGEILDVDGPCGGYNLQWAWSSGYVAGTHAAGGTETIKS